MPISFASNNLQSIQTEIPEPVADKYNCYVVCNEILVHFSWRLEYAYTIKNKTTSQWYQQNLTAYENLSGSYNGQYEQAPYQAAGTIHDQNNIQGVVDVVIVPDSSYYPSELEDIHITSNSNGTISYKDAELALTGVDTTYYSDYYNVTCNIPNVNGQRFQMKLLRSHYLDDSLILTGRVFISLFYIPTGELIYSTYDTFTDTAFEQKQYEIYISEISSDYESNGTIQTLKVYGCELVNAVGYQFDYPVVLWNIPANWDYYFLNTMLYVEEIWRNIVDVTSPVEPDTTARWGENLSEATPQNDLDVRPAGQEIALDNAIDNLHFSPQNQDKFEQWTGMFSNGKLIACCVFALACGSVILTLGKKKSE